MYQLIETSDGSHTIYVPELDEHYHSIHGAVQESTFIFIKNGFDTCNADPLCILEIGFGTGLNALLTAIRADEGTRQVNYTSLEKYPLDGKIISTLNYHKFAGKKGMEIFNSIHNSEWNKMVNLTPRFSLLKIETDVETRLIASLRFIASLPEKGMYDLIYFDAFGPDKQPGMWTPEIFESISAVTRSNGVLVTYSAKGEVKRNLRSVGFEVSLLPGPPGKRQMIRAVKF